MVNITNEPIHLVRGTPPNFAAICDKFPDAANEGVIFAYGDTVFYTAPTPPSEALMAHEVVHLRQQQITGGPEIWWDMYLASDKFRFEQELEAHLVEYAAILRDGPPKFARKMHRTAIAKRLSGPLYGHVVTFGKAVAYLRVVERKN